MAVELALELNRDVVLMNLEAWQDEVYSKGQALVLIASIIASCGGSAQGPGGTWPARRWARSVTACMASLRTAWHERPSVARRRHACWVVSLLLRLLRENLNRVDAGIVADGDEIQHNLLLRAWFDVLEHYQQGTIGAARRLEDAEVLE